MFRRDAISCLMKFEWTRQSIASAITHTQTSHSDSIQLPSFEPLHHWTQSHRLQLAPLQSDTYLENMCTNGLMLWSLQPGVLQPEARLVCRRDVNMIMWFTRFEFRMSDVSLQMRAGHSFDHIDQVPRFSKAAVGTRCLKQFLSTENLWAETRKTTLLKNVQGHCPKHYEYICKYRCQSIQFLFKEWISTNFTLWRDTGLLESHYHGQLWPWSTIKIEVRAPTFRNDLLSCFRRSCYDDAAKTSRLKQFETKKNGYTSLILSFYFCWCICKPLGGFMFVQVCRISLI